MTFKKLSQSGFHLIELVIVVAVIGVMGFIGFTVFSKSQKQNDSKEIVWSFDEKKLAWSTKGVKAPVCPEPLKFSHSPVNVSKVSAVLMPGAYRGFSYKPHGGFGVLPETEGKVEIVMPMDATLVGLTRYYEGKPTPDIQYLLTFESDCGIAFRFDHIYTLSSELRALADKTPEPKLDDTKTSPSDAPPRTKFKAGQVIATQVGSPSRQLYGFDFGVYDYRQANEISKNTDWAKIHNQYQSQDWFGVCWFDMLPGTDPGVIKPISLKQQDTRRIIRITSDYCSNAYYQTLDTNDGKPVEG